MEEDGTEPRPDIIAGYGRRWRRMAQNPTWHHSWIQEKMEEDGTEPDLTS